MVEKDGRRGEHNQRDSRSQQDYQGNVDGDAVGTELSHLPAAFGPENDCQIEKPRAHTDSG